MEPAPIRSGAVRPQGRPRRDSIPVLVRLVVIAGFAFAGWLALSASGDPASAAPQPAAQPSAPAGNGASTHERSEPASLDSAGRSLVGSADPDLILGNDLPDLPDLRGPVREIGDDPVGYLHDRRHDVFDRKDRAVNGLRDLADRAGVPRVRVPDVRRTPIVSGLAAGVVDSRPALDDGLVPPDGQRPSHGRDEAASKNVATARQGLGAITSSDARAGGTGGRDTGGCAGCENERHGPLAPVDQDEPWSGSAGGHQLAPVAELRSGGLPAVPPGVDPSTFHRTALTDVSAPGGPSVVPD
ncbi:MAG: hypothetical protein ACRDNL_18735 [Spirillospora sp.]